MNGTSLTAFEFLEEFSKSTAEKDVDHRQELENRVAAALEEGYQRGFSAGRAQGRVETDKAIREFAEKSAAENSAARTAWQEDIGARLAGIVEARISEFYQDVERQVAELLKPWLLAKLYDSAMRDFLHAVDAIALEGISVEIAGPQPLVSAVADRLAGKTTVTVSTCENDASIVVKTNGAVVSANFESWISQIRETPHE